MIQGAISNIVQPRFLFYEDCENGGNRWTVNVGTPNFAMPAALEGKLSFGLTASNDISKRLINSGSTPSASLHFKIRLPAIGAGGDMAGFGNFNNTIFFTWLNIQNTGVCRVYDTSTFGATTATMAANTTYNVWLEKRGTVSKLWFTTSSIQSSVASGSANFAQVNGTNTGSIGEVWLTPGVAAYFDDFQVRQI